MSAAELQHIRALLIAQTAEPEPRARRGPFGWLSPRLPGAPTPSVGSATARRSPPPAEAVDPDPNRDQELRLDDLWVAHEAALPPDGVAVALECAASLAPSLPRHAFGRRSETDGDGDATLELILQADLRLDDTPAEIDARPLRPAARSVSVEAAPFFPEDLMEPPATPAPPPPEPLRPWIKALRQSGAKRSLTVDGSQTAVVATAPATETAGAPPPARPPKPRTRRPAATPRGSGHRAIRRAALRETLEGLADRLAREQEILDDRLMIVAAQNLFVVAA